MDVVELREFYASPLGNATRRLIAAKLKPRYGSLRDMNVLGLGFASPYLDEIPIDVGRSLSFMLARQGVIHWPEEGRIRSALVDELDLPLLESTVDLAVVVHGLELTNSPLEMLQEIWRVMAPQGRLMLVVPNRRGLWASFDSSPFGYGQPFSRTQLGNLLKEAQFSAQSWTYALQMPPISRRVVLKGAGVIEIVGGWLAPRLSGVIIVEAVKQVYAFSSGKRARRLMPRFRPALLPAPARFEAQEADGKPLLL
jgi:SAM-dependent methyltransferase